MRIATYNVRNLFDAGTFIDQEAGEAVQENFFNQRISHFTKFFEPLNLDIICLQEVGGEKGVSLIGDALGYDYFFAKPNTRGIRMAVLYKKALTPLVHCESVSLGDLFIPSIVKHSDTATLPPISQRRDILVIDFEDYHGKKLRMVTFHLKSLLPMYLENEETEKTNKEHADAKFRSIFYKMMELRALRAFADKSFSEGREIIFLGDFNEHNNSSGIDILKDSNQEERALGDVLLGYKGDRTTHIHHGNHFTFDTMLVSPWVRDQIEQVSVENGGLQDCSSIPIDEEVLGSDHALVWMEMK